MNRNCHVDLIGLVPIGVARRIDNSVEKTFRDIKAMHKVRAFLNVSLHKRQVSLQFGIAFARRTNDEIEQLLRLLSDISLEDDGADRHQRAFIDLEPQSVSTLDLVAHAYFQVAVLAIEKFHEKGEIVPARWSEPVLFDRGQLFLYLRTQFLFLERLLSTELNI